MFSVIIVCTGNTCRSPMAEGILKSILNEKGVKDIKVSSAGIGAMEGLPATPYGIEAARAWDIDISSHKSRQLTKDMIRSADLILAMSPEHVHYILRLDPHSSSKAFLIKAFPRPFASGQESVRDPIGGPLDNYNQTYMELDETLRRAESAIIEFSKASKKDS